MPHTKPSCLGITLMSKKRFEWSSYSCDTEHHPEFICELGRTEDSKTRSTTLTFHPSSDPHSLFATSPYLACPLGHVTHDFLSCDQQSACWGQVSQSCSSPVRPQPPSFVCSNDVQQVSYSLVCDFRVDCSDRSDESFCKHLLCNMEQQFECTSGQVDIFFIVV